MKLLICDLDGVVNGSSEIRKHLVPTYTDKSSYWSEWHKAHIHERLNDDMRSLLNMYQASGFEIVYLTNRQITCGPSTAEQLIGWPGKHITMRHPLNETPTAEWKASEVDKMLIFANCDELVVIEDNAENLEAIRAKVSGTVGKFTGILVQPFK